MEKSKKPIKKKKETYSEKRRRIKYILKFKCETRDNHEDE